MGTGRPGCLPPYVSEFLGMRRNITRTSFQVLLASLIVLAGCRHEVPPMEPVPDRATPRWVLLPPDDDTFFHGVGSAPIGLDPARDREAALENARQALLSDIQARLADYLQPWRAVSFDTGRVVWDAFASVLDDVDPFDTYYDGRRRQYWCYLRLAAGDLEAILEQRRNAMAPRARRHLDEARDRKRRGELVRAIQEAVAAYSYCCGPEGLFMAGRVEGAAIRTEVEDLLGGLLDDVLVVKVDGPEQCRGSGLHDTRLVVEAIQPSRQKVLVGLPIAFRFIRGTGQIGPAGVTDDQGRASVELQALNPRISPVEIDASLDVNALLRRARLDPLPGSAWKGLPIPGVPFVITLVPPRLLLANIERGGTGGGRAAVIVAELADALRRQGIDVQEADVDYLVNPQVFEKVERGEDPGVVDGVDLIGVVAISLERIRKEKGQYQDVLYGEGTAVFRLFDLERRALVIDVRMEREVSGFSAGDVERNFFLQCMDELRTRVVDTLTEQPFFGRP